MRRGVSELIGVALGCVALFACGGRSSDAQSGALGGGSNNGGAIGRGGSSSQIVGGTAGSLVTEGGGPPSGRAGNTNASGGAGSAGAYGGAGDAGAFGGGALDLCLYPEDIPDAWSAAGAGPESANLCASGQLGPFVFDGCRYELLDAAAHDVDPFLGGHSHCCYRSTLLGCP